jgi:hypothetical protein
LTQPIREPWNAGDAFRNGRIMEIKDVVAIGFSTVSLVLSITTLYLTQLRPSNVNVSTGPMIHIFYINKTQPTVFLPVVFHNASPTKAIVYKAFLEVVDPKGDHFALKWIGSVKIDLANEYTDTELAGPFKIDGFETIPNALRFFWANAEGAAQLDWLEGDYQTKLHVWTSNSENPDYSTADKLHISTDVAKIMAEKKERGDNTSRYLPLAGKALLSFTTGQKPIDFRHAPWQ